MAVLKELNSRIASGELTRDDAQIAAAEALDKLLVRLTDNRERHWLFTRKTQQPKGLYFWGGVGRGKSMLMDWFYNFAPVKAKSRVHFHSFMLDVHSRINHWRKTGDGDPIRPIAKKIASEASLLCFDEFHVTDITDAMILSRLFEALWAQGIVVVATSNRAPEGLYENGLNRQLFEPFIKMMPDHLVIHEFAGATDHRLRQLEAAPVYYSPLGPSSEAAIEAAWKRLVGASVPREMILTVQGRELTLKRTAAGVARVSFEKLCGSALGAADYLKVAQSFQTLILENVPQLGPEKRNEAKRFVTLIDALYETRTKLIISAEVEPAALYVQGDGSFEFERTVSRLIEMRSQDYLAEDQILENKA